MVIVTNKMIAIISGGEIAMNNILGKEMEVVKKMEGAVYSEFFEKWIAKETPENMKLLASVDAEVKFW